MLLRKWDDLPDFMRTPEVRPYYDILSKKKGSILVKRIFDIIASLLLIIILAIPMIVIAILIKMDSPGPVMYRQERVTRYGKHFRIHKFRTMVENAESIGTAVTTENDSRITKMGSKLRDLRLDELPQLFDVLIGDMSFVGTRPEAVKYVEQYKPEYYATLLMPAGITSEASIGFKDESELLVGRNSVDEIYMRKVLPDKMNFNLSSLVKFSIIHEIKIAILTGSIIVNGK